MHMLKAPRARNAAVKSGYCSTVRLLFAWLSRDATCLARAMAFGEAACETPHERSEGYLSQLLTMSVHLV